MSRPNLLRLALRVSVFVNVCGALMFFFPTSIGSLVPLPLPVPLLYSAFCGIVIATFAGVYAWLARQEVPNRELVLVGAIGKFAFFVVCVASWLAGESTVSLPVSAIADAALATAFLYGLPGRPSSANT
jgi:hypothetical protein